MKFLHLISLGLASLLATTAAPVAIGDALSRRSPAPGPKVEPEVKKTPLFLKMPMTGLEPEKYYKFEVKWPLSETAHTDPHIEAARQHVQAKHFAFAIGKITKTAGGPPKKPTVTYDFKGRIYDLGADGKQKTKMDGPNLTVEKLGRADVRLLGPTKKTDIAMNAIGLQYIKEHPDFKSTSVNCKTFMDYMNTNSP